MASHAVLTTDNLVGLPKPLYQFAFVHFQNVVVPAPSTIRSRGFTSSPRALSFGHAQTNAYAAYTRSTTPAPMLGLASLSALGVPTSGSDRSHSADHSMGTRSVQRYASRMHAMH